MIIHDLDFGYDFDYDGSGDDAVAGGCGALHDLQIIPL